MPKSVYSAKYTQFRKQLIGARKAAGMTQSDLALRLGKKQSHVSKYERAERRLDIVEFLEIAEILGIDVIDFVRRLL